MVDRGNTPAALADQLDRSLASVYEALSYYDDHVDEVRTAEHENEEAARRASPESLKPKESVK